MSSWTRHMIEAANDIFCVNSVIFRDIDGDGDKDIELTQARFNATCYYLV